MQQNSFLFLPEHKETVFTVRAQVDQGGCGTIILEDIEKPSGQRHQSALGDPA